MESSDKLQNALECLLQGHGHGAVRNLLGAKRMSPSCKGSVIFLFYNPKKAHRLSTVLPHALLLMKISPTDADEE